MLAFIALQFPLSDYIVDDAYIHLTFAQNIANGDGFAFNPGQLTYGVTAPLWTLTLSFLSLLFTPGAALAKTFSILFGALSIVALGRLARTMGMGAGVATLVAYLWAVDVWNVRWSAAGMETSLTMALLFLAFAAQLRRKPMAGLWLGLATLCRPEVGVFLAILVIDYWWFEGWRKSLKAVGLSCLVILPWLIFAAIAFGTIIPNPALVKADAGLPLLSDFLYGLKRTVLIIGGSHGLELLLIAASAWLLRGRLSRLGARERWLFALLLCWALFPSIMYLSRGVFITSRYLIIGLPPLTLLAFLVLSNEASIFKRWKNGIGIKIFFLLAMLTQLSLTLLITIPHVKAFQPSLDALHDMAQILREETPPGSVVAVGDVGIIGFEAERDVLDFEGLVSKEMIQYRIGRSLEDLIFSERYLKAGNPDYIIDKAQNPRRLSERFGDRREIIRIIPIPGGLVDTAHEQWYYTLYRVHAKTEIENTVDK